MAAFCRLRKAVRLFRLDRIVSFEMMAESFERPRDFSMDQHFKEGFASQRWKVHLRFDANPDEIRLVFGSLGEVTTAGTGHDYLGPTDDLDFMARTLLFSGLSFRVLGPPELKHAFSRIAAKAATLAD